MQANNINVPGRGAVAFAFDIPLDSLKAGLYICQVNVIDDTGSFSFPRQALLVRASAPACRRPAAFCDQLAAQPAGPMTRSCHSAEATSKK